MNKAEIKKIFDELNEATQEYWDLSKNEDEAKIKKIAGYKKLQLARAAAHSIKFD